MCQPRRHLDLAEEPLGTDLCRDIRAEHFHRDRPFVTQVAGEKNDRHAPLTKEAFYIIAADETGFEALLKLNHEAQYWGVRSLAARARGLGSPFIEKPFTQASLLDKGRGVLSGSGDR